MHRRWTRVLLSFACRAVLSTGHSGARYARVGFDIETVWVLPEGKPVGIFFIAHGCKHQATDIVRESELQDCSSSNFGSCLGLPEELKLRDAALIRGYVVMAVSGTGYHRCWDMQNDLGRVLQAVQHVRQAEGLEETAPVLATGASSGGAFMGRLAGC
eukprot:TRINITY_DN16847_c0_g1_i1.p1 TRINITY_DN16847_c0_g1~~TRINITY_DN16847_c0_g1_i1.p1  ORF type:complete len:172 (+),score=32.07 TRINITY_DN16847_c0_g1_i1:44-517(+)